MNAYQQTYQDKCVSAAQAVATIDDRSNVVLGMSASMPPALMQALAQRAQEGAYECLDLFYMHSTEAAYNSILQADLMHCVHPHPLFMSAYDRALAKQGRDQDEDWVGYIPCMFHQAGRLLTENISPDVFMVTVSPMDRAGYFSLGTNADYGATVILHAKKLILEVNENMPRTFGENQLHINDVDLVVEHNVPLMQGILGPAQPEDIAIAGQIAEEIPNGATLQMGIGAIPNIVLEHLAEHEDLGLHSELFSPPMVSLIRKGVLNGRAKTVLPHKHVFTLAIGDEDTYDFMDDNPSIAGYPASWVNNPYVIRKNDRMVSVNSAIEIDLTGQINASAIGGLPFSGTGGQLDFVRGAYASRGGKSFIAMRSVTKDTTMSKIVPTIQGGTVTDTRMDTHFVVTEYGKVNLKGRSLAERAELLISIAHPDFRDELKTAAEKMHLF
jgi:itaconate CoA-transferase